MLRPRVASSAAYKWGATAFFIAGATILAALGFEYLGRMQPCPLCLQQRWAYYAGIPVSFLALVLLSAGHPRAAAVLFGVVGVAFLANAGLAGYHAGVEWGFWPGPDTCAAGGSAPISRTGNLLKDLENAPRIVRCDEAAWRFGGLSFAGWNLVICLMLSIAALKACVAAREHELYL